MKMTFITLFVLLFMSYDSFAQSAQYPISIVKKRYYQNEKKLTLKHLKQTISQCPEASPAYEKFKSNFTTQQVLLGSGSACILTGAIIRFADAINQANDLNSGKISRGDPTAGIGIMLVGLGLTIASIPLGSAAKKHMNNAVDLYNQSLKQSSSKPVSVVMMVKNNQICLRVRF